MLALPLERLAYIIAKAREFDAEVPAEPDAVAGSDPPDDDEREVLLDTPDNPTEEELRDAIDGLGPAERQELHDAAGQRRDARVAARVSFSKRAGRIEARLCGRWLCFGCWPLAGADRS